MKITEKTILKKLEQVMDPEINISIVDLGLVYDVKMEGKKVKIIMTLTTMGCPLVGMIEAEIKEVISKIGFKKENIKVELTFDPPWSMEKMSKKGRSFLGI